MKTNQSHKNSTDKANYWIKNFLSTGDKSCLGKIFEHHKQQLFFHCLKIIKDQEEAKDQTSETFIKAFEKIHKFDLNKPFYPWLAQIATNLCIDLIRRKKIVPLDQIDNQPDLKGSDDQVADLENAELNDKIKGAIKKLKRQQKRCFCLFYIHEKSYKEIVKLTGFSNNEVRSYIQNGKRKVKLILEREKVGLNFVFAVGIVMIIQIGWQTTLILRDLKGWG
ncbi:sigma-70 family RNA polymerase sigma factor [candidate division KSB1 bacterium]|nr:sigma-70 family RNA polymerase sigma factor [candidate division KSB1 bacterium]MBL7093030.1 sigma-70 family RNA polymerase sigma factor [candidate division KSB1 bacterium]